MFLTKARHIEKEANMITRMQFTINRLGLTLILLTVVSGGMAPAQTGKSTSLDSNYRSPQSIDGSRASRDANPSPQAGDRTENISQGQRVFEALFRELDNMIPGDFEPGSEVKKSIEDAVTAFQLRDVSRVEQILKDLAASQEGIPPADLLLATLSYAIQDSNSGLLLLERAAVNHPDYPGVYSAFARLAINQGRISDALALLEKCESKIAAAEGLTEDEKQYFDTQCLDGLTDVAMRQGRLDDARKYLERQREDLPDNAKVLMVSAELEFKQGNIEQSEKYLNSLKENFSSTRAPETILASWYSRSGKKDEAEKWIRAAAEKYPNDPQVQLEFASWAIEQEDFPTASSAIIRAEKASSESLQSRNLKGKIAFANQSYGIAEAHFQACAEKQPNNFEAINMYALSLIESDKTEKQKLALDIATRSFRALPDNVVAQAALGFIELKMGRTEQAKTILTRAARTAGSAPEIDYFLASLLAKLGETQQAKLVLESAVKHEGIFLYRKPAEQLLKQLSESTGSLPEPEDK
jgi:tetratricopeptide (TPR) repeat protein